MGENKNNTNIPQEFSDKFLTLEEQINLVTQSIDTLTKSYEQTQRIEIKEKLLKKFIPQVKLIASKLSTNMAVVAENKCDYKPRNKYSMWAYLTDSNKNPNSLVICTNLDEPNRLIVFSATDLIRMGWDTFNHLLKLYGVKDFSQFNSYNVSEKFRDDLDIVIPLKTLIRTKDINSVIATLENNCTSDPNSCEIKLIDFGELCRFVESVSLPMISETTKKRKLIKLLEDKSKLYWGEYIVQLNPNIPTQKSSKIKPKLSEVMNDLKKDVDFEYDKISTRDHSETPNTSELKEFINILEEATADLKYIVSPTEKETQTSYTIPITNDIYKNNLEALNKIKRNNESNTMYALCNSLTSLERSVEELGTGRSELNRHALDIVKDCVIKVLNYNIEKLKEIQNQDDTETMNIF